MDRLDRMGWALWAYAAFLVLVTVGLPLLAVALGLLAVSGGRWPVVRGLVKLAGAVDAAIFALMVFCGAMPFLGDGLQALAVRARTYHLGAPDTLAEVPFPAGSTVQLRKDGNIGSGTVPVATMIDGLPVVGPFSTDPTWDPSLRGTLAVATTIAGVPCGPGRFEWYGRSRVSCILEREIAFAGYPLAAGQPVTIDSFVADERALRRGTLARPEALFDVTWPAGSLLLDLADPSGRGVHGMGPQDSTMRICLLAGQTAAMQGATLHGTITFSTRGDSSRWFPAARSTIRHRRITPPTATSRWAPAPTPRGSERTALRRGTGMAPADGKP